MLLDNGADIRRFYEIMSDLWFDSWISVGIANETDLTRQGVRTRFFQDAEGRWDLYAAVEDDASRAGNDASTAVPIRQSQPKGLTTG